MQSNKGSYKGIYRNGVVHPEEPVAVSDGQKVIFSLVEPEVPENQSDTEEIAEGWLQLRQIIEDCQIETGVSDLAHQHDHYLHGTPKQES
ncbi:MAG: hypothetical protein MUC48_01365 [Leptolyngbya sp. Prado105]|nr:hypothetical protein [Leptolyngbya sp. Prado105]